MICFYRVRAIWGAAMAERDPGIVDVFVGRRLRARRMALGMPQEALAERAGLTTQQIQKYEAGVNRIAAGRLGHVALILGMQPADFYVGADVLREAYVGRRGVRDVEAEREVCDLLIAYVDANSSATRTAMIELVRTAGRRLSDRKAEVFAVREVVMAR